MRKTFLRPFVFVLVSALVISFSIATLASAAGNTKINKKLEYDYLTNSGYYKSDIVINTSRLDDKYKRYLEKAVRTWNDAIDSYNKEAIKEKDISEKYGTYGLTDLDLDLKLKIPAKISISNKEYTDIKKADGVNFAMFKDDLWLEPKALKNFSETNGARYWQKYGGDRRKNGTHQTTEFRIVINKPVLNNYSETKASSVFLHELGHMLGLDEALSTATIRRDGKKQYVVDLYKQWRYSIMYDQDYRLGYISWLDILEVAKSWNTEDGFEF